MQRYAPVKDKFGSSGSGHSGITAEALSQSESRLRMILDKLPAIVWTVDLDLKITFSHGAGLQYIGYQNGELEGVSLYDYLQTKDPHHPEILHHLSAIAGNCQTRETVVQGRTLCSHLEPLKDSQGNVQGAIGFCFDISDRKEIEEKLQSTLSELRRSNEDLKAFATLVSHDLQEPLRTITSYINLIRTRLGSQLDNETQEMFSYILDASQRMRELLCDVLHYSKVGTDPSSEKVNMDKICMEVCKDLKASIDDCHGYITFSRLPEVTGDPILLRQLVQNLIGNALKFKSERAPKIYVSCETQGQELIFKFEDNGVGFSKADGDRIFDIFQRGATTADLPGTGVGLAVCKKVVATHGGRIWATSNPGQGASFYFSLPLSRASELP